MFDSLHIENFRGIAKLDLDGLGRVNLVMGPNNSGKTSLLEAVSLASTRPWNAMTGQLPFREESGLDKEGQLRWLTRDGATSLDVRLQKRAGGGLTAFRVGVDASGSWTDVVKLRRGTLFSCGGDLRTHSVPAMGKPLDLVDVLATAIRAPADEQLLTSVLASVDDRVRGVRIDVSGGKPFIAVDIGLSERMPLSRAGLGMVRLVGILSELLGSKPEVCFIDEIENGVHYSALPALWRGIAEIARRLDIQVFATTHSWECFLAAHTEFDARPPYDLRVIQMFRGVEAASGRLLDEAHVRAAIAGDIDLR